MAPKEKSDFQFITNQLIENGYNGVFEILKTIGNYDRFEKFICYLKDSQTIRIQPSKEQLLILKDLFKKFSNNDNIIILQTLVISMYSEYMPTCYSIAEQHFICVSILDMILIKGSMDSFKTKLSKSTIISSIIDINLNNFDNPIIKTFIQKLLNYTSDQNYFDNFKLILSIITLLLKFKKENDNNKEEEIENQVIDYLKSNSLVVTMFKVLFFSVYQASPLNSDLKRLNYGSNSSECSISSDVTNYILESCSINKGYDKKDFNLLCLTLLLFQTKSNSRLFQKKMKNEIIDGVCEFLRKPKPITDKKVDSKDDDDQEEANLETGFKEIISLLIDNQQFDLIFAKNLFSSYNGAGLMVTNLNELFEMIPFDTSISIFSILLKDKKIKKSKIREFLIKKIMDLADGSDKGKNQIKSIFKINENEFRFDEFILLEIYEKCFERISQSLDLESIIPSLFSNLSNSPTKFKFIKPRLGYLIESLNYNSISNWITSEKQPYIIEKCEKSKIFNLKKLENYLFKKDNNNNTASVDSNINTSYSPTLSNILIQEIILKFVDNKSTSMYQKLQISLVSKRFFQIVRGFINSSTFVPVLIKVSNFDFFGHFFRQSSTLMNKSLLTTDVKSVEIDFELFDRNSIKFLSLLLNNCKSITLLYLINLEAGYNPLFAYLCWFKTLKKLTIRIPSDSYEGLKLNKLITSLKTSRSIATTSTNTITPIDTDINNAATKEIKVELLIDSYEGPPQTANINLHTLSISIEEYFRHGSFKKINGLNELDLIIGEYTETTLVIKYCKKHFQYKDDESFDQLQVLSIQILGFSNGVINEFLFNFFKFFRNKSKNIKEFKITIDLENNGLGNTNLESIISIIFKILSSPNLIGFQNLKQITILNNYNQQFKSLKNIEFYNFKQRIFNETTIHSFEFIKKEINEIDQTNDKDDEDSDSDSGDEGFEFDTYSSNYEDESDSESDGEDENSGSEENQSSYGDSDSDNY